jgi:hypothetical protein
MKINKYIAIVSCVASLLLLIGCSEDFLNDTADPLDALSPSNTFVSPDGLDAALVSARRLLRTEHADFPALTTEYFWTDISYSSLQNSGTARDAVLSLTPFQGVKNGNSGFYWSQPYVIFRDVNAVIARIDDAEYENDTQRNEILGAAYFHRAYWYYRLVHLFGDVPWTGQEVSEPKIDFETYTVEAILTKIKTDMEFAVQWLPETTLNGKVNRAAGNHLLTKIYLSLGEFDNAIASASAVINDGKYALMTNRFGNGPFAGDPAYDVTWDLHQRENMDTSNNTETLLLAIDEVDVQGSSGNGSSSDRNWGPLWWLAADTEYDLSNGEDEFEEKLGRGVSWARPNNHYAYTLRNNSPNDSRFNDSNWWGVEDYVYNKAGSAKFGQPVVLADEGIDTISRFFGFPRYKIHTPRSRPGNNSGGYKHFYIFRLAETYLLRAEAYMWNGQMQEAANDVNVVRQRAGADPKDAADMSIDAIMDERAVELYAEEPRKTELSRVSYLMARGNIGGYSLATIGESNYYYDKMVRTAPELFSNIQYTDQVFRVAPYHIYWPIPQNTINANSLGQINQNFGYTGYDNNVPPKTVITEED